jgi:hypothetical protein
MPTYGWVREDAWEAFLAATSVVPGPVGPLRPSFLCPFCVEVFANLVALGDHIAAGHRIDRPALLISGREPGSDSVIRTRNAGADFVAANATSAAAEINGVFYSNLSPAMLARKLAGLRHGTATVTLSNAAQIGAAPVNSTYRLSFRIADARALQSVERAFQQTLVDRGLSVSAVTEFLADRRCEGTGSDYAGGLANYAMGVLIKERPDGETISSPVARYRELFGSAIEFLAPQTRPLAHLLCSIMRFAMNDLSIEPSETGFVDLDVAMAMLRGPWHAPASVPSMSGNQRVICPIDHGTGRIIDLAVSLSRQERWGPILSDACRQVAEADSLDLLDREKALAMWAVTAWRLGARAEATGPLARLSATSPFSTWAAACLEEVSN